MDRYYFTKLELPVSINRRDGTYPTFFQFVRVLLLGLPSTTELKISTS